MVENLQQNKGTRELEYIENNMVKFINILRHLGVRISSAEAIDAMKALELVDLLDQKAVRSSLKATLAKDAESAVIFEHAFNSFFVPPERKQDRREERQEMRVQEEEAMNEAQKELTYKWEGMTKDGYTSGEAQVRLTPEELAAYTKMPEEKKKRLKDYLARGFQGNTINDPRKLIEDTVKSAINYWKYYLRNQELKDKTPIDVEYTGNEDFDSILEEIVNSIRDEERFMYEDMQNIGEKDLPKVTHLIKKLSQKLATRITRRYRQSKKKQKIDLRRTIRSNIQYGGALFGLKHNTRKIQKPKILLICDVSGSMARYAGFVLQFIYGLSSAVDEIESFIFAEDVERVTHYFKSRGPFEETMVEIMNKSKTWGKGTNLNKALSEIASKKNLLTKDTFVIIVSDTKTTGAERAAKKLGEIHRKVKDIIWLNTLPKKDWNEVKTVNLFRKNSHMFECNTLAHLDKIMRTQMLR